MRRVFRVLSKIAYQIGKSTGERGIVSIPSEYFDYTKDECLQARAEKEADRFVREETQFQLGHLPTEQPHPYTLDFSREVKDNPVRGIARLLQVDGDLPPVARRIFLTEAYDKLVKAIEKAEEASLATGDEDNDIHPW